MSFRQYGGINYAARNNIVKNNYSNANNLSVMTKVGQPSSIINFESDLSANIIYSDLTVDNLTVSGNDALINGLTVGRGGGNLDNNTAIGCNALKENVLSYKNVAIGYNALANNTGPKFDGLYDTDNTAVGHNSLYSNTTGYWNTAVGLNALYSNIDGYWNTAIGLDAGNNYGGPTSCHHCTFIGSNTGTGDLNTNTSYSYSTAIGYGSRITENYQITLGTSSETVYVPGTLTVVKDALINGLTVGKGSANLSGNTAVGVNALKSNVHGINNTAIGDSALYSDVSGNYNTALGFEALYNNLYSEGNTALGLKALRNNISGINNVAIGLRALYCSQESGIANGSGNYNVAVGNFSLYSNQSASNNTAVGNSALYSNTTGTLNTAVGNSALYSNSIGSYNTALGNQAMYSYNETVFSGVGNTAIGNDAMFSNVSGLYCTAVGYQASYHQTGSGNTSLGFKALWGSSGVSSGNYNCAFGDSALTLNTTGSNNIAIGYHALHSNTTGSQNTVIGFQASYYNNTDGNYNTAVGYQASHYNNSGNYNTAVGHQALLSNSVSIWNTAFGVNALYYTTGGFNTAVGVNALYYNVGGTYNTAIGSEAGTNSNTGPANCNNCTFIGRLTTSSGDYSNSTAIGFNSTITDNNQIMLGTSSQTVQIPGTANMNTIGTIPSFNLIPAGMIMAGVINTTPTGWFLCDGTAKSRTTYSILFDAINTIFGSGDGINTFNVPNYKAAFLRGAGINGNHTATLNTSQEDSVKNHTHPIQDLEHEHSFTYSSRERGGDGNNTVTSIATTGGTSATVSTTRATTGITTTQNNNNGTTENLVYNYAVNYYIKY